MFDPARERLASMLAQFSHEPSRDAVSELNTFEGILPRIAPRIELVAARRLEVTSLEPRGVITVLALPAVPVRRYVRHIAAALLMGNSVLLAPLTRSQRRIADGMARACPGSVRLAGTHPTPDPVGRDDALVVLGDDRRGDCSPAMLCNRYSRRELQVTSVRATFLAA